MTGQAREVGRFPIDSHMLIPKALKRQYLPDPGGSTLDSTLLLSRGKERMLVTFSAPGNHLTIRSEEITEGGKPYCRIGIGITKPALNGQIVNNDRPLR